MRAFGGNNITSSTQMGVDVVTATQIATDAVAAAEIAANAVGDAEIASHTTTKITVPTTQLSGTVAEAQIADNAVTLAKVAHGTQGGIIYFGASGAPTELAAGTAGQLLRTGGAGANPSWSSAAKTSGGSSCTNVTVLNTTTETDLMNVTIPGGTLGTTGALKAKLYISILNESNPAATLTVKVYYGTTVIATDDLAIGDTGAGAVGNYGYIDAIVVANGATNAQDGSFTLQTERRSIGSGAGLRIWGTQNGTAAEDSTADKAFKVSVTWSGAATNRSVIMYHYFVDLVV